MNTNTRKNSNSYIDRWNKLVSSIMGNTDIYDYHLNIESGREYIVEDMTKGSVRLQMGMIVSVPETDKLEKEFIKVLLP